jgi:hypothetical protein
MEQALVTLFADRPEKFHVPDTVVKTYRTKRPGNVDKLPQALKREVFFHADTEIEGNDHQQ